MADTNILVVVSKLKAYVKDRAGLNTSGAVAEKLSDIIRKHCDIAIESAKNDGRKTLLDRDFDSSACGVRKHESINTQ